MWLGRLGTVLRVLNACIAIEYYLAGASEESFSMQCPCMAVAAARGS